LLDRGAGHGRMAGWLWVLAAAAAGTLCMVVYWSYSSYWDVPGMVIFWRTLLAAFFLCVVAAAVHVPSFAQTWPFRPLRYLGEVSYGIYLWHLFAIEACLRMADITPVQALATTLGLTVLAAAASWHFFEKPILDCARRLPKRRAAALPAAGPGAS